MSVNKEAANNQQRKMLKQNRSKHTMHTIYTGIPTGEWQEVEAKKSTTVKVTHKTSTN